MTSQTEARMCLLQKENNKENALYLELGGKKYIPYLIYHLFTILLPLIKVTRIINTES